VKDYEGGGGEGLRGHRKESVMRYQKGIFAAVLAAAALGAACDWPTKPDVSQDVDVNVTINAPASPAPTPSPSPSPSPATGTVAIGEVRVPLVGENCPAGITPANAQRTLRVGCSGFITCTPKVRNADGTLRDALPHEHGAAPRSFGITAGAGATFAVWPSNPFNADAKATAAGSVTITCEANAPPEPNRPGSNVGTLVLSIIS
jgi:hypothetical protein